MPIDMKLTWYCRCCHSAMLHRGDILICPNQCSSVLPTDSDEVAHRVVISPVELGDELGEMASRAAQVDAIAARFVEPSPD